MKAIPKAAVTLASSTAPASTLDEWVYLASYTVGDRVKVSTEYDSSVALPMVLEYEATSSSAGNYYPPNALATQWVYIGAGNEYRMLDNANNTTTEAAVPIVAELSTDEEIDTVAALGLESVEEIYVSAGSRLSSRITSSADDWTAWTLTGVEVEATDTVAPDGSAAATTLRETTGTTHKAVPAVTAGAPSPGPWTLDVLCRSQGAGGIALVLDAVGDGGQRVARFDLREGTLHDTSGDILAATIVEVHSGYYQCSLSLAASVACTALASEIYILDSALAETHAADTAIALDVFAAEMVEAMTPSPWVYKHAVLSGTSGADSWWGYFFGSSAEATKRSAVIDLGLSLASPSITARLQGYGTIGCAHLLAGLSVELGNTLQGPAPGFRSFSTKEIDTDLGAVKFVARPDMTLRRGEYQIVFDSDDFDVVYGRFESLIDQLALWDANNAKTDYDALRAYGWAERLDPEIRYRSTSYATLRIQEIT